MFPRYKLPLRNNHRKLLEREGVLLEFASPGISVMPIRLTAMAASSLSGKDGKSWSTSNRKMVFVPCAQFFYPGWIPMSVTSDSGAHARYSNRDGKLVIDKRFDDRVKCCSSDGAEIEMLRLNES